MTEEEATKYLKGRLWEGDYWASMSGKNPQCLCVIFNIDKDLGVEIKNAIGLTCFVLFDHRGKGEHALKFYDDKDRGSSQLLRRMGIIGRRIAALHNVVLP